MRVRSMQMNDSHIYCTESQFEQEFTGVINLYLEYFKLFGITEYVMRLSTHHPRGLGKKYVNNPEMWLKTEEMVRNAMIKHNIPFVEVADEAAFYGPKIDVQVKSAIGREFSLATNQVDFAQSERFDLNFINEEGQEERPVIIHRAPLSTHERLIGFLLEHYAGAFPVWLSPEQVRIIPITDEQNAAAQALYDRLHAAGIRAEAGPGLGPHERQDPQGPADEGALHGCAGQARSGGQCGGAAQARRHPGGAAGGRICRPGGRESQNPLRRVVEEEVTRLSKTFVLDNLVM